jgi:hypothetical protein
MAEGEDYPSNLLDFQRRFPADADCRAYLEKLRWPDGFRCPACGHDRGWASGREGLWECTLCHHQTTVTAGTLFDGTRKPLRLWFLAMWFIVSEKNGISALGLQRQLGFQRYETVWTWLHKLRRAMVRPGRDRLSGRVEVDETYVGGEAPGAPGRGAENKQIVAIAAEEDGLGIGRIRLRRISPTRARTACCPSFRRQSSPGRSSIRTAGKAIASCRNGDINMRSRVSNAAKNWPPNCCLASTRWLRSSSAGSSERTRAPSAAAISTITSMNSPFDSIAANHATVANCSTASFSRPWNSSP